MENGAGTTDKTKRRIVSTLGVHRDFNMLRVVAKRGSGEGDSVFVSRLENAVDVPGGDRQPEVPVRNVQPKIDRTAEVR